MELWKFHNIFLIVTTLATFAAGKIRLVENGYERVVVSVDWDVQENLDLFKELEGILTSASSVLFRATKNRLYFREFIFVIPEDWQTKAKYENALDVEVEQSDVIVDRPNAAAGNRPYTLRTGGCGTHGHYIHLTPDYLLDNEVKKRYGPPGKTFVHEWGHLRWGLFDEYAENRKEGFYRFQGKWFPTRCSEEIDGVLKNTVTKKYCKFDFTTGLPEENCEFVPFKNTKAVSSLMSYQFLDNVIEFCDDSATAPKSLRHNPLPPNLHNTLCQYQSAWEVMRQHDDFKNRTNSTPLPNNTDTTPTFRYVQANHRKRVLVLDTSGSMDGTALTFLRQAASNFILSSAEQGSQLGIVQFDSTASVLSELVTIDSQATRAWLVDKLPTIATGGTSIGAGLNEGQQVLSRESQLAGGSIILITDGEENTYPWIRNVTSSLIENGIVVHTFAFGQQADNGIAQLARATGGKIFFYSGTNNSTGLIDGFAALTATAKGISNRNAPVSILTDAVTVAGNVPWDGSFHIDSTIGKNTTLTFSYTEPITVEIENPDGINVNDLANFTDHRDVTVLTVALEGDLTPGLWKYRLTTAGLSSDVKINIESKARQLDGEVLQIRSWVSELDDITFAASKTLDVYAEVVRGRTPVLGASVVATVERPLSDTSTLRLRDDGIGSDIIKGDGIYSASIIASDLTGNGRYSIKINVVGTKQNTRILTAGQGPNSGASEDDATGSDKGIGMKPLEDFQRVTTAGEFRIKGYFPITVDELAPARITDFNAKSFDTETMKATFEWTAVGGDMDRGQAARYIMYISNDQNTILSNIQSADRISENKIIRGNLNSSAAAGQGEEFVVLIDNALRDRNNNNNNNTQLTCYLSVSAVDHAGNEGQPSNIVTLSRAAELSIPREVVEPVDSDSDSNKVMYIAIGVSVACVTVIIIVSVILVVRAKKKSKISNVV